MKPFQNSTGTFTSLFLVLCDPQTLSAKLTKAFQLTVKEVIKLVFQGVKNSLFMLHFINTCILGGGNFQICKSQGLLRLEEPRFCPKPHSHIVDMGKWLIMEIANGSPKLGVTVSLRHGQCRGISCWNLLHLFQHFVFKCTACERIFFLTIIFPKVSRISAFPSIKSILTDLFGIPVTARTLPVAWALLTAPCCWAELKPLLQHFELQPEYSI